MSELWDNGVNASAPASSKRSEAAARSIPPLTDRGVSLTNVLQFGVHWLTLTVRTTDLDEVCSQVPNILFPGTVQGYQRRNYQNWQEICQERGHGGWGYKRILSYPLGVSVYLEPINEGQDRCTINIPGSALEAVGAQVVRTLLRWAEGRFKGRWSASRVDLAWDGFPMTPGEVKDHIVTGNIRTKANRESLKYTENPLSDTDGSTCYLGAKTSPRRIRVYDKRGPVRLELQLREGRADAVVKQFLEVNLGDWSTMCMGHLRDFMDLVDVESGAGNISRSELLPAWSEFLQGAERAGLVIGRTVVDTLDGLRKWIRQAVAPSLAILLEVAQGDLDPVLALIDGGRDRWGRRHRAILVNAGVKGWDINIS